MARELGPQGIHVAHIVIDGAIDTQFIARELSRALRDEGAPDGILNPDAIAENYWLLHQQPAAHGRTSSTCGRGRRSSSVFELEARQTNLSMLARMSSANLTETNAQRCA